MEKNSTFILYFDTNWLYLQYNQTNKMINFKNFFRPFLEVIGLATPNLSMKPVKPEVLYKKLKKGKVNFFFKKKDGSLRMAHGTLKLRYVPSDQHPQGLREPTPKVVTFYDLIKKQWRCVSTEQEIFMQ